VRQIAIEKVNPDNIGIVGILFYYGVRVCLGSDVR